MPFFLKFVRLSILILWLLSPLVHAQESEAEPERPQPTVKIIQPDDDNPMLEESGALLITIEVTG